VLWCGYSNRYRGERVDYGKGSKLLSLHIRRAENGTPATHPLSEREMRELRRHQRESAQSPFAFVSEWIAALGYGIAKLF
jgi:hypothetical protein